METRRVVLFLPKRIMLHYFRNRSYEVRRRSAGNWINKYCTKSFGGQYECNLCSVVLILQQGHYGNMRRHYKLKHPYTYHTETEKSKKVWRSKRKVKISKTKSEKDNVEKDSSVDIETKLPKTVLSQVPKKRRSTIWQHFTYLEKGFVCCQICNMKLKDKHYVVVLHLNRRHPNTFAELENFNVMPFRKRSNLLWNFFVDEGDKLVRCLLCGITMRKNMAKHLQKKHPDNFELAVSSKREEIAKFCEPRQKAPRTWVKKYCAKVADKEYKCNQCKSVLRMPNGLFGNMRRHIRIKHPKIYCEEMNAAKEGNFSKCLGVNENMIDLLDVDDNSNALNLKDPLADFDLGSPAVSETEMAANFLEHDNLESNLCSERDLEALADIPVLEPSCEADNYDKSYYLLVENGQYKCVECEETVNCPNIDEQEALFTHIRDKHPEEIMTLQATSSDNDDEYQVVVLSNIDS